MILKRIIVFIKSMVIRLIFYKITFSNMFLFKTHPTKTEFYDEYKGMGYSKLCFFLFFFYLGKFVL